MKKAASLILALVLILSMGTVAFADSPKVTLPEVDITLPKSNPTGEDIIDAFKDIIGEDKIGDISSIIEDKEVTLDNLNEIIEALFTDSEGKPSISDGELTANVFDSFIDAVTGLLHTDKETVINKICEIPAVRQILEWLGHDFDDDATEPASTTTTEAVDDTDDATETSDEDSDESLQTPDTGVTAGIAAFATLSAAAAAAYISGKKKKTA